MQWNKKCCDRSNFKNAVLSRLEECLYVLHIWFCHNGLALNPDKTDVILHVLGANQRTNSIPPISNISVAEASVPLSNSVKLLGVTIDNTFTFNVHISAISKTCFYNYIRALHIRSVSFSRRLCQKPNNRRSLVGCRLD